jgi:uncharacterized protein (DUF1330 family)
LLALLIALVALPSTAFAAKTKVAVGIGDQNASIFSQPNFKKLKVKKVRYFIRWNAVDNPGELAAADAYVAAAKAAKVRVLMHISTDILTRASEGKAKGLPVAKLPSVKTYKQKIRPLIKRFGGKTIDWGTWNEVNHDSQPTYRSPKRAAQFFVALRSMCRGCKIVALDVLDQRGVESYIKRFYKALKPSQRRAASVVGMHHYSDTTRYRQKGRRKGAITASIIKTVKRYNKRAKFWMTETGGLASFGRSFPCGTKRVPVAKAEKRQAIAISDMFTLAKRFRSKGVERLYSYNYWGTDCQSRFDAGLVHADGSARPAYKTFKRRAARFIR